MGEEKKKDGKRREKDTSPRILRLSTTILGTLCVFVGALISMGVLYGSFSMESSLIEKLLYACIGLILLLLILIFIYYSKKENYGKNRIFVSALLNLGSISILVSTLLGSIHKNWIVFGSGWIVGAILIVVGMLLGRSFVKNGTITREELKGRRVLADERTLFIQGRSAIAAHIISTLVFVFLVCICLMLDIGLYALSLLSVQYFAMSIPYSIALLYYGKRYGSERAEGGRDE